MAETRKIILNDDYGNSLENFALEGKCEPNGCYCSYGPEALTVVSPKMGPVAIPPSKKARARFGEMVYGPELEEWCEANMTESWIIKNEWSK